MPGPVWTASRMSQSLPVAATELRSVFPQGRAMVHLARCAVFRSSASQRPASSVPVPGVPDSGSSSVPQESRSRRFWDTVLGRSWAMVYPPAMRSTTLTSCGSMARQVAVARLSDALV